MPPTMPICIALALLTVIMTEAKQPKVQLAATAALGIAPGLSVNIRIANALLAFGYLLVLAINLVRMRGRLQLLQGFLFCATFVAGILPTLVANSINAGSPFSTPYSSIDLVHDFSWASVSASIAAYGTGTRGAALWAAILSTAGSGCTRAACESPARRADRAAGLSQSCHQSCVLSHACRLCVLLRDPTGDLVHVDALLRVPCIRDKIRIPRRRPRKPRLRCSGAHWPSRSQARPPPMSRLRCFECPRKWPRHDRPASRTDQW